MRIIKRFFINLLITVILLLFIAGLIVLALGYINYRQTIKKQPIQEKFHEIMNRDDYVPYDEISPYVINATIAIEDREFLEHNGIDIKAITRSLIINLTSGSIVSGGSTITQQVVKNLYFDFDYSFLRKVSEIFFAYDIENQFSKEEIISVYLNIINYGDNYMGIYQACHGYYNKEPSELGLTEASLIAGIPQSPSNLQLSNHLSEALNRQKLVLKAMLDCDMLTEEEIMYIKDLYGVSK